MDIDAVIFLMSTLLEYGAELLSQCAILKVCLLHETLARNSCTKSLARNLLHDFEKIDFLDGY